MEVTRLGDTGIKIKTKIASVVVDPTVKTDAEILIRIDRNQDIDPSIVEGLKLIIDGPGEYEVSGISVTGERVGQEVMYRIDDEQTKVLLASSRHTAHVKEESGEDALLLKAVEPMESDTLSSFVQDICIVFGNPQNLPKGQDSVQKAPKINLRKLDDMRGKIVVLVKE